jgi:WD40 repeat protein
MSEENDPDLDYIDMQSVKLSLTCKICNKIFSKPILLPCNSTMCKIHLADMPNDIIIKKENSHTQPVNIDNHSIHSLKIASASNSPPSPSSAYESAVSSSLSNSYDSMSFLNMNKKRTRQDQKINYFFRCFFCKDLHELGENRVDENGEFYTDSSLYKENELAKNMILNSVYMSPKEKKLKNECKKLVVQFNEKLNNLARKHLENFNEIRDQINLQKTKLKLRIDEIASKMIEKVNKYENIFKNNTNSFLIQNVSNAKEFKEIKTQLDEEFRNLKINTDKIQKLIDSYKNETSPFFNDAAHAHMGSNFLVNFKPNINFKPEIFGELFENSNEKTKMDNSSYLSPVNFNNHANLEQQTLPSKANNFNTSLKNVRPSIDYSNHLISCSFDTSMELKIWNLSTGQCIRTFKRKEKVVCCTTLSSSNLLASGYGKTIKIWNLDDGNTLLKLDNKSNVYCLILLLNGRLASGALDNNIRVWELEEENGGIDNKADCCIDTLTGHTKYVISMENLQNGDLLSSSFDMTLKIWELNSGICLNTIELLPEMEWVRCLKSLNNNSKLIACGHNDRIISISIWNIDSNQCIRLLQGHQDSVWDLKMSKMGHLISCSLDSTIKIWNINSNSNECLKTLTDHSDAVLCLKLYSNDKLISGSNDRNILIWDLNKGVVLKTLQCGYNVWSLQ